MRNRFKISLILIIVLSLIAPLRIVQAQEVDISQIEIYDLKDGTARIKWSTLSNPTRGIVYYGLNREHLDKWVGYSLYEIRHESVMTGLEKNQTYYFKILAFNRLQEQTESFIQAFSTKDMIDTIDPKIEKAEVLQTTNDAIALYWKTNEPTKATIYYGIDNVDSLATEINYKKTGYNKYHQEHVLFIYKLGRNQAYRVKIEALDEAGNKSFHVLRCRTQISTVDYSILQIKDLTPLDPDGTKITNTKATLDWRTNLISKSKISYGTQPGKNGQTLDVVKDSQELEHAITLIDLEPDTKYYYKINIYDALYGRKLTTDEMSFTTKPTPVNPVTAQPTSQLVDTDGDGLIDSYEIEIGTDPNNADTDRDGYPDGHEIKYGYSPKGPDKLQAQNYFKPTYAQATIDNKKDELEYLLNQNIGEYNLTDNNYQVLLRAYMYGGYPIEAIVKALRFGGKTVHPAISWQTWQHSLDYQTVMNRSSEAELRDILQRKFGSVNLNNANFQTLTDAYQNRGYPIKAIEQAVRFGGKTVHPSLSYQQWKNSADFKNYIDR
ncbi:MAG: hypothetical protein PHS07_02445 [Patescibacteria group bacterium]|nr:hypothetical protein [Patescibacteria group bacterium]